MYRRLFNNKSKKTSFSSICHKREPNVNALVL